MASKAKKSVELFYDVISPYSWIAFEVLCRYRNKWAFDLVLKPFFLGGVMAGADNKPPATVANKAVYMMKDLDRAATHYQIPIRHLSNFVETAIIKGTLKTQRFVTAVSVLAPEKVETLSRVLFYRIWHKDLDATEPDSLREASKTAGISEAVINEALQRMNDPDIKGRLKATTQEALDLRAFGAPWIVTTNVETGKQEQFFGSDRFPFLAEAIGEKYVGPLNEYASKYEFESKL